MEIFIVWILLAVGVGVLANSRGRNGFGFFLLSAVLSPLIGLIVVLVTEDLNKKAELAYEAERDHQRRLEEVRAIAGSGQAAAPPSAPGAPAAPPRPAPRATFSLADELTKLADLRDRGVLTAEEFAQQKAALLAAGSPPAPPPAPVPTPPPPPVPQGQCPNCDAIIPAASRACPKCNASFGVGSAWSIKPLPKG